MRQVAPVAVLQRSVSIIITTALLPSFDQEDLCQRQTVRALYRRGHSFTSNTHFVTTAVKITINYGKVYSPVQYSANSHISPISFAKLHEIGMSRQEIPHEGYEDKDIYLQRLEANRICCCFLYTAHRQAKRTLTHCL